MAFWLYFEFYCIWNACESQSLSNDLLFIVFNRIFVINIWISCFEKKIKSFLYSVFILLLSGIVGLGFNSTSLLATLEYSNFSTRGASELTINPDGSH